MDWFSTMRTAVSGLDASRLRMDCATNNLANADNSAPDDASTFMAQRVYLEENTENQGVKSQVFRPNLPPRLEYLPGHPDADAQGMVRFPDIDVVQEMTDLMAARRAYEIGLATLNESRHIFGKTLEIGKE